MFRATYPKSCIVVTRLAVKIVIYRIRKDFFKDFLKDHFKILNLAILALQ